MAHKEFKPFEKRNAPTTAELISSLKQKTVALKERLNNPSFWLHAKDLAQPSPKKVNQMISDLGFTPNHTINGEETFKGLYAWARINEPEQIEYIGISQNLGKRLRGHVWSKNKNIATWAYLIAKEEFPGGLQLFKKELEIIKKLPKRKYDFPLREEIQQRLKRDYFCTIVLVDNDYELYMLEPYCSLEFESHWNVFQTH
jgi:hypothetical protein